MKPAIKELIEKSMIAIKDDNNPEVIQIAEAIALFELKKTMLEVEAYEDLAEFRKLEVKYSVDISLP
jgi:hypothetical protein